MIQVNERRELLWTMRRRRKMKKGEPEEDEPENSEEPEDSEEPENSEETENTDDNDADNDADNDTDNNTDNDADNNTENDTDNDTETVTENASCPECWELNTAGDACVMTENNNCCEMSCDNAKMTFSFEPKMFRLTDASDTAFFGSNGPTGNTLSGKYEYSHGLGASGQSVSVDGDEMLFSV